MNGILRWALTAGALTGAAAAWAQGEAKAASDVVVETESAFWFEAPSNPDVVFYFPKMETRVYRSEPAVPGVERWRAGVFLRALATRDPGAIKAEWAGKIARPYAVTLGSECTLVRDPSMRFVQQDVYAENRDVSGAETAPICEYIFRLPTNGTESYVHALEGRAAAGTLITKSFTLAATARVAIAWTDVRARVAARLAADAGDAAPARLTKDLATSLALAAAQDDARFAAALAAAPPSTRAAYDAEALAHLFVLASDGTYALSPAADGVFAVTVEEPHAL